MITPLRQHPAQLRAVHQSSAQYRVKICDGIGQGSIQQQVQTHPQRYRQPDLAPRLSIFSACLGAAYVDAGPPVDLNDLREQYLDRIGGARVPHRGPWPRTGR